MSTREKLEKVLEHLLAEEETQARDLLHDVFVEIAQKTHSDLIENDSAEVEEDLEESSEENKEEAVDEAVADEVSDADAKIEEIEQEVEDEETMEAPEEDGEMSMDDAEEELDDMDGDDDSKDDVEDRVDDLESALDELKAEFDELVGDKAEDEATGDDMDSEDKPEMEMPEESVAQEVADETAEETVREYVEKAPAPKGGDDDNTHSPVADAKNKIDGNGAKAPEFGGGDEKGGATPKSGDMGQTTPKPDMKKV
jgi:hypothetical protein